MALKIGDWVKVDVRAQLGYSASIRRVAKTRGETFKIENDNRIFKPVDGTPSLWRAEGLVRFDSPAFAVLPTPDEVNAEVEKLAAIEMKEQKRARESARCREELTEIKWSEVSDSTVREIYRLIQVDKKRTVKI